MAWSRSSSPYLCSRNEPTDLSLEAAGRILNKMADVLPQLLSGFTRDLDAAEIRRLQDDLGRLVTGFQEITAEARRERMVPFTRAPDPAPLSRTLLRLRHDLVILGRAAEAPLPGAIAQRLAPLHAWGEDASAFLFASAIALTQGRPPPPLEPVEAPLDAFDFGVASLRSDGLTRALSTDEVERLFALWFCSRAAATPFFRSRAMLERTRRRRRRRAP